MARTLISDPMWGSRNFLMSFTTTSSYTMFQVIIMIFSEKLMNQTWTNDKKPNFGPDFGSCAPDFSPYFFAGFTSTSN